MRVVFDTNVFVSAFAIPGSLSDEAYRRARAEAVELFTSVAILTELASTLRGEFGWEEMPIKDALKSISRVAEVVKTEPHLAVVRDATDNRILECAELVQADLIVTGDIHLLKLRRFGHAGIVRVATFLRILGGGRQGGEAIQRRSGCWRSGHRPRRGRPHARSSSLKRSTVRPALRIRA